MLFAKAVVFAALPSVVLGDLIVLQSDPTYCIEATDRSDGSTLKLKSCNPQSALQRWSAESAELGGITWTLDGNGSDGSDGPVCVEATQLEENDGGSGSLKSRPRMAPCTGKKKQRWMPNLIGGDVADLSSAKDVDLCIGYPGSTPESGRNIKLLSCSGQEEQGWLWLSEEEYEARKKDGISADKKEELACIADVKLCDDGVTWVGRDPKNGCNFKPCPDPIEVSKEDIVGRSSSEWYVTDDKDPIPGVAIRTINPEVMDGYDKGSGGCSDLFDDLYNATLIYANERIKRNSENWWWGNTKDRMRPPVPVAAEVAFAPASAATLDRAPASPTTTTESSFETNNQEAGVDEADVIKSDGKHVFAAYGDVLVVWDAATGKEMSRTKMPEKEKLPYEDGGLEDNGGGYPPIFPGPVIVPVKPIRVNNAETGETNDGVRRRGRRRYLRTRRDSIWIPRSTKPRISGLLFDPSSNRVAVIVSGYRPDYRYDFTDRPILSDRDVIVRLYDTSNIPTDGSKLSLVSETPMIGNYRAARMIGGMAHLAMQSGVDTYPHIDRKLDPWQTLYDGLNKTEYVVEAKKQAEVAAKKFVERLIDELSELSATNGATDCSGITKIALFASSEDNASDFERFPPSIISSGILNSYIQVSTFDMSSDPQEKNSSLQAKSAGMFFPTSYGQIYSSKDVMVIAGRGYNRRGSSRSFDESTHLLAFRLSSDGSAPSGMAIATVPGYLLNQFSMDEHKGYLRIATTTNSKWGCIDEPADNGACKWGRLTDSRSQLIILELPEGDDTRTMKQVAELGDLGVTEVIFSARFFDDRCYIVTFERTDPLYSISLEDPTKPEILHELKITGFSSYLHPVDDNRLLAIGREADEETGRITGFQITLFNTENREETTVQQRWISEAQWASSAAENDQYAFRYLPESKLLLLPMSIYEEKAGGPFDGFKIFYVGDDEIREEDLTVSMVRDPQMYRGGCWYDAFLPPRTLVFDGQATFIKSHGYVSYDLTTADRKQNWAHNLDKDVSKDQCYAYWR